MRYLNTRLKTAAVLTTAVATAIGWSGAAHARGQAYAEVSFAGFQFQESSDGVNWSQVTLGQTVTVGSFLQTATNTATRDAGGGPVSDIEVAIDSNINNGINVNPAQACIGACPAEPTFTRGNINSDSFVRGDGDSVGTGFIRDIDPTAGVNLQPDDFTINLVSEAIQQSSSVDLASALNQNVAQFTMTLANETLLRLNGDVHVDLYTELLAGINGAAQANVSFSIQITPTGTTGSGQLYDPTTFGTPNPPGPTPIGAFFAGLAFTADSTTPGDVDAQAFSLLDQTVALVLAGPGTYNVSLNYNSQVQLETVPEPGPLALVGLGVLGAGMLGRRRQQLSAAA